MLKMKLKFKSLRFVIYGLFIVVGFTMAVMSVKISAYDRTQQFLTALGYMITLFSIMPILLIEQKEYLTKGK